MTDSIHVTNENAAFDRIGCPGGVYNELREAFTFRVPGYQWMPAYKKGTWDGKIRVIKGGGVAPVGLREAIRDFAEGRGYGFETDDLADQECDETRDVERLLRERLGVPDEFETRDYQVAAIEHMMNEQRSIVLSPTGSGKSLMIYAIGRWWSDRRKLLIVPTKALVDQMAKDFRAYGYEEPITMIHGEVRDKSWRERIDTEFTISTWQSIYRMDEGWFDRFGVLLGDEVHEWKAKSLTEICEKSRNAYVRYGFTGTLDDAKCHALVLEGSFGKPFQTTTSRELQDSGRLAELDIKMLILRHPADEIPITLRPNPTDDARKQRRFVGEYQDEQDHIASSVSRRRLVVNLMGRLRGNTLVLFTLVDRHGRPLHEMATADGMDVEFIHGGTTVAERERIRGIMAERDDVTLLASYGTFSRGVNVPEIDNIVFASSYKSRIRTMQSIGRGLRKGGTMGVTTLYDIADDLRVLEKQRYNHSLRHAGSRRGYYEREGFPYTVTRMDL